MADPLTLDLLAREAAKAGVRLPSAGSHGPLLVHLRLMYAWNRRMNLTAIRDPAVGLRRHLLEALVALPELPPPAAEPIRLADLGSGNGFPALPLVIVRGDLRAILIESSGRKADFLRAAARGARCLARTEVRQERLDRIEQLPDDVEILTLRAFPEPGRWIEAAVRRPAMRRVFAWLSTETARDEAANVERLGLNAKVMPLPTHGSGSLLSVSRATERES